jgi:catechol 2,3-dioxygenase-like lactoylglutathione lyase family enzyme
MDMKVEWMNHTGFVVSDMERSLAFYRDLLGLEVERNTVLEGEFISQLVGYPNARLHIVYLGVGDARHAVELVQYLNPPSRESVVSSERRSVGATHLGIIVDDLDSFYRELSARGVRFVNPPAVRPNATYPFARKGCYLQDPDGNWLELLERPPAPPGATQV